MSQEPSSPGRPRAREDAPPPAAPFRAPTIYDVARAAGVAASTVSRTFSRPGRVASATAERVRRAAEDLGYRANPLARALPTGRTSMIAVVISDVTNPFYFDIIRGAESAAAEAGYIMLLADTQESDRLERRALERVLPAVEGIVLAGSRMSDAAIRTIAKQRPVLVLNRAVTGVPCVVTDNASGMRLAAAHLRGLGHGSITYVAGPEQSWADGTRWRALREVSDELGLRVRRTRPCAPTVAGGLAAAADLAAASPAGAVVAYNDQIAIGVMRGLAARGVRVPQDISVVGFDNIFGAELVTPGLTTVVAPLRAQGYTAVRNLLSVVGGARPRRDQPVVLPARLVVRGSTGRRSRKRTSPALGTTKVPGVAPNSAGSTAAGSR